jgi:tetratricopeptide (TPR) repeat protein
LTLIEQLGDPNWLALALTNLSEALIDVGDWAQGRALLERARALCPPGGSWTAPSALGVLAKLNAWQGRWAETHALLEECLRAAGAGSDGSVLHGIRRGLAEIDLLEGRPEATILRLEPLLHGHAEEDLNAVYGLPLLAHAYLQTGNLGGARHAADTAVRLLRSSPGVASMAFQARALVAVAESRWQEAEDALSEALRVAREWGSPYSEALVLLDIGLLRVRRGDPAAGRDLITRALETLRRLDAAPAVQRAEEALAALA